MTPIRTYGSLRDPICHGKYRTRLRDLFNTDDDGIAFSDRYCVTGDTSVVTPSGLVLWEKLEYGDTFSSENVLLQHFRDLGYKADTLETLTKTLDEQEVYIHSFINPYQ